MNEGFVFDAFLSHSSRDKHFIPLVPERWRKDGPKVWFDEGEKGTFLVYSV